MGKQFLIDTNIIIYFLDDQIPDDHVGTLTTIFQNSFNISTITKVEVLGWHLLEGEKLIEVAAFLENANVIYVNPAIEAKSIELKRRRKMKTPDALIGATAIIYNFTLVTRNEVDFNKIPEITIYNPFK